MSKNFRNYFLQLLLWLVYYGLEFYIEILNHIFTKTSIIRYLLGVQVFYVSLKILKISRHFLKICLIIVVFLLFMVFSLLLKYETIDLFQKFSNPPISIQILYVVDNFARLFGVAFIYSVFIKLVEKQKQAIIIENQLFAIETNYLNSKIDTHFFLNSLNIFYAHFLKSNSVAAQKVIQLSSFVKNNL